MKTIFTTVLSISLLILNIPIAKSQITYIEQFSQPGPYPSANLPFGWSQNKVGNSTSPYNVFDRLQSGFWPVAMPLSTPAFLRYDSFLSTSGDTEFVASKKLDMSNMPLNGANIYFWMFRDSINYQSNNDRIRVFVNTIPDIAGATLLAEDISGSTSLNRSCSLSPTPVTYHAWNQYFYTIPFIYSGPSVYFIIEAISNFGNDIYIDDINITSYPNPQVYVPNSAETVFQDTNTVVPGSINNQIIGCKIKMDGAAPIFPTLTHMGFSVTGTTNPADVSNIKLWYSGGTPVFNSNGATFLGSNNNALATNFTMIEASPSYIGVNAVTNLDHGDNYFWLTYDISATAIIGDCVDAEWISVYIDNPGPGFILPNPTTLPGCRPIGLTTGLNLPQPNFDFNIQSVYTTGDGINVNFDSNTSINYGYKIVDVLGKIIALKEKNQAMPGSNNILIPLKANNGIYFLIIQNERNVRVKKFVY